MVRIWTNLPVSSTRQRIRSNRYTYILTSVYESLKEKGYDPINQIVGYILSEDPHLHHQPQLRPLLICKIDRDELLQVCW